jgi:hypothetical protein
MCTCTVRTGKILKPSGRIVCADCGGLIEELPKPKERP